MERLRHRGPDGAGLLIIRPVDGQAELEINGARRTLKQEFQSPPNCGVILGHRRLSIIDPTPNAAQPMATEDGRYLVAFNGEIYNYIELRTELESMGERFCTRSDTEVLLRGFARWGLEVLQRLEGMFALVLLDRGKGTIVLARDCFGMKPLYYARGPNGFAFASEIGALLPLSGIRPIADSEGLQHFLVNGNSDHRAATMFAGIMQVPAAHYLEFSLVQPELPTPVRYWAPDLTRQDDRPRSQLVTNFRELFFESIALHLRSDVRVGALLSGGVDSSAVVAGMREVAGSKVEINTFSYVPEPGTAISEEPWIDDVTTAANAQAHKVGLRMQDWESGLANLVARQEQPFGSIAIAAQQALFRRCAEAGIRVVLDGQASDELFGGYSYARSFRLAGQLRRGELAGAWRHVRNFSRSHSRRTAGTLLLHAGRLMSPEPVIAAVRQVRRNNVSLVNHDWFDKRNLVDRTVWRAIGRNPLRMRLLADIEEHSLPGVLRVSDRNAMTFSVENRLPFLTRKLAQFAFSLPDHALVDDYGQGKALLRDAFRGLIPDSVLDRRKVAFAVPLAEWLTASKAVQHSFQRAATLPFIDQPNLSRLLKLAAERRLTGTDLFSLWRVFGLVQWLEVFDVQLN